MTEANEVAAPTLSRSLRSRHVSMIAIGGIIGAGLFVGSSTTINQVGPAAVLSWLVSGFIILLVMRMISEMALAMPGAQGFPDYIRAGLGPLGGFLAGWLYWFFWVIVIPIEAIAGAKIIHDWYPIMPGWAIGVLLTTGLTIVNLMSAKSYGEFEFWFSSIKVAAIIVFILLAGAWAFGVTNPDHQPTFANLITHDGYMPFGFAAVLAGSASTIFSMAGAEIATIAAAESNEPSRIIARMGWSITFRILIFYVVSVTLITAVIPWTDIVPGQSPFAAALTKMNYPFAGTIMNAIVLVAVLSCLNSAVYVTSRALFGLARHGDAPQWLVTVNTRKVPVRAILLSSAVAFVALMAERASGDMFNHLVNAIGAVMLFLYMMIAAAQLRLRPGLAKSGRLQLRMWFHPWGTLFAMAAMLAVLMFMALKPELASQFWESLLVAGLFAIAWVIKITVKGQPKP